MSIQRARRHNKGYALLTAFLIATTLSFLLLVLLLLIDDKFYIVLVFCIYALVVTYIIFEYIVRNYIDNKIRIILEEIERIDDTEDFDLKVVNTDMNMLVESIKDYKEKKRIEIEVLKGREDYRREFIGNVAHELKTPLFTIQGYILTLLDGAKDKPELCTKYLKRTSKGVERLNFIVNDLDLITKLEIGDLNLNIQKIDIIQLIESVFEFIEIKAKKKNISLVLNNNCRRPLYIKADEERIRQVLMNLIVNSVKYGNEKGTTEVSIEELIEDKLIIRVTDNGEGIKNEHISRIFERFYRVSKSRSREEGGSGLGLSIVKHIIEAHNEKIYVESIVGIGSEFSFTLQKASQNEEE